jgi:hypothetical protein
VGALPVALILPRRTRRPAALRASMPRSGVEALRTAGMACSVMVLTFLEGQQKDSIKVMFLLYDELIVVLISK